jgi:cell division protein FtsA
MRALSKGSVIESIELTRSIEKVMDGLKSKSGINIKSVYANISGQDIIVKHSHALVPLWDKRGKVITVNDIQKVNEQALILGANLDDEVLMSLPNDYSVDMEKRIANPLGLFSRRLGVDVTLICGKSAAVRSFYHVINSAGYDVKDLVLSGLATAEIIFNKENHEGINVLCDIGADVTEILIFKNGVLTHIEIALMGGDGISLALQEEFKISFDAAEEIKKSYGVIGNLPEASKDKEILLKEEDMYKPIKQGVVADIVTSRAQEMCLKLKECIGGHAELGDINNFFAAGRTVLQDGFLELLEGAMGIPVRLGRVAHPQIIPLANQNAFVLSSQKYLTFLTSLGIICWAVRKQSPQFPPSAQSARNPIFKVINKVRELYREYF